jgi:hypothetical protein
LKKIERSGGPVQTLCDALGVLGGTWNRHGDILMGGLAQVQRVPEAGGTVRSSQTCSRNRALSRFLSRWTALPRHSQSHSGFATSGRVAEFDRRTGDTADLTGCFQRRNRGAAARKPARRGALHARRHADGLALRYETARSGRRGIPGSAAHCGELRRILVGRHLQPGSACLCFRPARPLAVRLARPARQKSRCRR